MADSNIPVTPGAGNNVDTRTVSGGDHRQVVVQGDPSDNNAVAAVVSVDPGSGSGAYGTVVRMAGSAAVNISGQLATLGVSLDPGHELGSIKGINSSVAVYFDRGNPSVSIGGQSTTLNVQFDPGHTLGIIDSINKTVTVQFDPGHELGTIKGNSNTLTVFLPDTGHELGSIKAINSSVNIQFDPGHTLGKVEPGVGTFQVFLPDTGHEIGSIRGNTNTLTVFIPDTGHTLGKVDAGLGTFNVKLDPGYTLGKVDQGAASITQAWLVNAQGTASLFTVSGSTSGVSPSGVTLIAPSASYNFKVYAYSIQTTGAVSLTAKFTNGAGAATEFWRPLVTAAGVTGAQGANLSTGGGDKPLFTTGTNTTLALLLDTATLVHYSVSYTKESA